jgi:hypothetical protein
MGTPSHQGIYGHECMPVFSARLRQRARLACLMNVTKAIERG